METRKGPCLEGPVCAINVTSDGFGSHHGTLLPKLTQTFTSNTFGGLTPVVSLGWFFWWLWLTTTFGESEGLELE
ncbi:hypothetical protein TanjilG_31340 [Lupinus angustifolius]|uniref:Uncharacterized protein n=1 Tax=Lupinus angustifolius TaxID=3871 RepID=A0A4P1RU36_LUPAN|nr:hypothetical protein TanjilG_31340 [Lupinus angustifolius]